MDGNSLREITAAPSLADYLKRLWRVRDFMIVAPLGQLEVQTRRTTVGWGWHLMNPLLSALLYYVVFGILFRGRGRVDDYGPYLIVGIFVFLYTHRAIMSSAGSLISNAGLMSQAYLPRAVFPASAVIAETVSQLGALVVLMALLPIFGASPRPTWLLIVPLVALQMTFNMGLGFMVARLTFQFRDLRKLLPHALRFLMYGSGVFFTADWVGQAAGGATGGWIVGVFQANPVYMFMALSRDALLGTQFGFIWMWWALLGWATTSLIVGFLFFRVSEREYGRG